MTDRQVAVIAVRGSGYMFWLALMSLARAYMPRKPYKLEIVSMCLGASISFNAVSLGLMLAR